MLPQSAQALINELTKLPDIGPRAASRLVFYLLNQKQGDLTHLGKLIHSLKSQLVLCRQCFNLTEKNQPLCAICQDKKRNVQIVCVVENFLNIAPFEKTRKYTGLYHVLGGLISPPAGIGPDNLRIKELLDRVKQSQQNGSSITEIIFALNPTAEGDTTAFYLERLLKETNTKITRLARGLSIGSDLEYIDENTLANALTGRK